MKKCLFPFVLFFGLTCGAQAAQFSLKSPQLVPEGIMMPAQILNGFGCSGQNISPELIWENAPGGTKSFAVTVYDPDAPTGSGWWHWTIFNIPASVSRLTSGAGKNGTLPENAVEGRTDFGTSGYGGGCPPKGHGPHRYQFRVWALDVITLPLDETAPGALVGFYLNQHKLDTAEIQVLFER